MERPLLRLWVIRLLIAAIPTLLYLVWRRWALKRGRTVGATPWGWLLAAGIFLAAASLLGSVAFQPDNRGRTYVPPHSQPDGSVTPGHFE
jgi:hypothetical protein